VTYAAQMWSLCVSQSAADVDGMSKAAIVLPPMLRNQFPELQRLAPRSLLHFRILLSGGCMLLIADPISA
jgi:hypothetical protein